MWDQKFRRLTVAGFKGRPQSPLRRSRERYRANGSAGDFEAAAHDYAGIGTTLRDERERQGRRLEDVATALHIQQRYLEAIEEGRFDNLPGSTYATGFLRSYSRFLGLDPEQALALFRRESTLAHGPTKLRMPERIAEPRRPRATVVLVSLLAAAVLYAGWAYFNTDDGSADDMVALAPERLAARLRGDGEPRLPPLPTASEAAPAPAPQPAASGNSNAALAAAREAQRDAYAVLTPAAAAVPEPAAPSAAPAEAPPAAETGEDMPPETPALETVELPQTAPPIPQPPPRAQGEAPALPPPAPSPGGGDYVPQRFGGGDVDARVVVRAKVDSWVQIQGARNETLLTRILRPGDTFYAPDRRDLMLTTGNVGGLEIIVDGAPLGPLGPVGAVRRNISLDAEKLLVMAGGRTE